MNDRFEDAAPWSTAKPAWSPLLVLGGSVVAAVMVISGGLALLGTEVQARAPEGGYPLAAAPAHPRTATLSAAVDLKSLQGSVPDDRR